ncbi:MAG: BatD family protein, partial [candidate division KSB1 bacterium]|nr:BatD family protein [candidate division KSB1 bacterium]
MNRKIALFFIFSMLFSPMAHAQDSLSTAPPDIRVIARVSTKEVPLNRSVIFTVQVEWAGDLARYEISEIENPEVRNFKIMSNSSADRREMENNVQKAVKTFEFGLAPEELGMGYIEGVIIKYLDVETGDGKHLITNRLEVKVVDPLPE